MLLAIVGALMMIDRQLSFLFEDLIILVAPVIIIIYSTMYEVRDGLLLCFGLLVLTFLFGNLYSYCYMPIALLVGVGYSFALNRNLAKKKLMLVAMMLFIIGEILITYIIFPLLGYASIGDQLAEMGELMAAYNYDFSVLNISTSQLLLIILCVSAIIMGVTEGLLTHLLVVFLLKRFKIRDIGDSTLFDLQITPLTAYLCIMIFLAGTFISRYVDNETLSSIVVALQMLSAMILIYSGYIFCICFGRIVLKKNITFFVLLFLIFLMPFSLIVLMVLGFLFGSGPLKSYLERKMLQ